MAEQKARPKIQLHYKGRRDLRPISIRRRRKEGERDHDIQMDLRILTQERFEEMALMKVEGFDDEDRPIWPDGRLVEYDEEGYPIFPADIISFNKRI